MFALPKDAPGTLISPSFLPSFLPSLSLCLSAAGKRGRKSEREDIWTTLKAVVFLTERKKDTLQFGKCRGHLQTRLREPALLILRQIPRIGDTQGRDSMAAQII